MTVGRHGQMAGCGRDTAGLWEQAGAGRRTKPACDTRDQDQRRRAPMQRLR
jgi:hypothetical protein